MNYYNENDPKSAAWLRELIARGEIPTGDVDERSITNVDPTELIGYTQHHFFAGIAGWSRALRLSGWPESRPVVTGSCPCQPFSVAGNQEGASDERHLWPAFFRIIQYLQPDVIFGEQVPNAIKLGWIDNEKGKAVCQMQYQQAILRVLHEQSWGIPEELQQLLCAGGEDSEIENSSRNKIPIIQAISESKSRKGVVHAGETQGKTERDGILFDQNGRRLDSVNNRRGGLPGNGDSVQSGWRKNMGQSITGQDQFEFGIPTEQYSSGSLLHKCDGEYLGHSENSGGIKCDTKTERNEISCFSEISDSQPEINAQPESLNGIRDDLEGEIYAFGFSVFGACSVRAPHRRQRIYWVARKLADTNRERRGSWDKSRTGSTIRRVLSEQSGGHGSLADSECGNGGCEQPEGKPMRRRSGSSGGVNSDPVADSLSTGLEGQSRDEDHRDGSRRIGAQPAGPACESGKSESMGDGDSGRCGEQRDQAQPGSGGHIDSTEHPIPVDNTAGARCEDNRECRAPGTPWDDSRMPESSRRIASSTMGNSPGDNQQRNTQPAMHGGGQPAGGSSGIVAVGEPNSDGRQSGESPSTPDRYGSAVESTGDNRAMGDSIGPVGQQPERPWSGPSETNGVRPSGQSYGPGKLGAHWGEFDIILCRDGKYRRIPRQAFAESSVQPVADGLSAGVGGGWTPGYGFPLTLDKEARVPLLRGSGNAIVPHCGAAFIVSFLMAEKELNL